MTREVTEADMDRAVAGAFGRVGVPVVGAAVAREAFLEAGFSEELADRGVRLLESGLYFGFEDVATSLGTFNETPLVEAGRVAAAGDRLRRVQEVASGKNSLPSATEAARLAEARKPSVRKSSRVTGA